MGVGKSTVGRALKDTHEKSIYLDGDLAWEGIPFILTEDNRKKVIGNVVKMINDAYEKGYEIVILGWVMDQQDTINAILKGVHVPNLRINTISLIAKAEVLKQRLEDDINKGIRNDDGVIARSLQCLPLYQRLHTTKIDTSDITIDEIVSLILEDCCSCGKHQHKFY